jgi:hypothetical protein
VQRFLDWYAARLKERVLRQRDAKETQPRGPDANENAEPAAPAAVRRR